MSILQTGYAKAGLWKFFKSLWPKWGAVSVATSTYIKTLNFAAVSTGTLNMAAVSTGTLNTAAVSTATLNRYV